MNKIDLRRIDLNLDWRPPILDGLSLDMNVSHSGRIIATRDNCNNLIFKITITVYTNTASPVVFGGKSQHVHTRLADDLQRWHCLDACPKLLASDHHFTGIFQITSLPQMLQTRPCRP